MIFFADLIQQIEILNAKLDDIRLVLFRGKIDDARRMFYFIITVRNAIEEKIFNTQITNPKLEAKEKNLIEYAQYHLDMAKANAFLSDTIAYLGLLGSARFETGEYALSLFFERDMRGVTNGDFRGDETYYLQMIKELAVPVIDRLQTIANRLVKDLGALKIIEQQKESRLLHILKTLRYKSLREKSPYKDHVEIIDYIEDKIGDFINRNDFSNRKVTGRILQTGTPYDGMLHAWLPMPLGDHRIVYTWDVKTRTITYITIGTHKELGLL
ncbi:hypothetical protein HY488_00935 [Candidatus Woesearchaeota archaeon]|nr:hypothetical protein [Candidatus Woesearchaeota archaeon]